jgi:hypothetical protein
MARFRWLTDRENDRIEDQEGPFRGAALFEGAWADDIALGEAFTDWAERAHFGTFLYWSEQRPVDRRTKYRAECLADLERMLRDGGGPCASIAEFIDALPDSTARRVVADLRKRLKTKAVEPKPPVAPQVLDKEALREVRRIAGRLLELRHNDSPERPGLVKALAPHLQRLGDKRAIREANTLLEAPILDPAQAYALAWSLFVQLPPAEPVPPRRLAGPPNRRFVATAATALSVYVRAGQGPRLSSSQARSLARAQVVVSPTIAEQLCSPE